MLYKRKICDVLIQRVKSIRRYIFSEFKFHFNILNFSLINRYNYCVPGIV